MTRHHTPQMWQRKTTGVWYVTIRGQQYRLGPDHSEAVREYGRLLARTGYSDDQPITMTALFEYFWGHPRTFKSASTKDSYMWLQRAIPKYFRELLVSEVKPYHLEEFLNKYGPTGDAATARAVAQLRRLFSWGIKQGYAHKNPAQTLDKPAYVPREDFIPPEYLRRFIYAIKNPHARLIARFILETGARVVEARTLEASDLVLKQNRIILKRSDSKGKVHKRVIFLNDEARRIVRELAEQHPTGSLFRNTQGGTWTAKSLNRHLARAGEAIGLSFTMCGTILRHSFAYLRLSSGQDVATVAKLMGHCSTEMVYKVYGHLCKGTILEDAANAVQIPGLYYSKENDQ